MGSTYLQISQAFAHGSKFHASEFSRAVVVAPCVGLSGSFSRHCEVGHRAHTLPGLVALPTLQALAKYSVIRGNMGKMLQLLMGKSQTLTDTAGSGASTGPLQQSVTGGPEVMDLRRQVSLTSRLTLKCAVHPDFFLKSRR